MGKYKKIGGKKLFVALILASIIAVEVFILVNSDREKIPPPQASETSPLISESTADNILKNFDVSEKRSEINALIDKNGEKKAYEILKDKYKADHPSVRHIMVHIAGEEFYKRLGIDAMGICDGAYAFGCFHGLMVLAIADKGVDVIYDIDKKCNELFPNDLSCQHGLGHGILDYLGHENLAQALDLCTKLSWDGSLLGCQDGLFMEYDFPSFDGTSNIRSNMREFEDDAYSPCYDVNEKFRKACFYARPRWWIQVFNFQVEEAAELCTDIKEPEYDRACFIGMGMVIATFTDYDADKIIENCNLIKREEDKITCFNSASWAMPEEKKLGEPGTRICAQIPESQRGKCKNSEWIMSELYD